MAAWVGLFASGASAIGQKQAGDDAAFQAETNAMIHRQEGKVAEQQSLTAEGTQRQNAREFLGRQAASFAEAGVSGGSAARVMNQSAINAELDALNVRYRGQLTKFGYDYNSQSALAEGSARQKNSNLAAGGTLLKGVSSYYASANG